MEHRWNIRKPHQCSVIVDCPRTGLAALRLRNIGIGGMFVDTGNVNLPLNSLVNVAFTLGRGEEREEFCFPAYVVRRTDSGAGIMFLESELDVLRNLHRALGTTTSFDPEEAIPGDRRMATDILTSRNATALKIRRVN